MDSERTRFQQLVLSGGGTRCYWQGGFLHVVEDELRLDDTVERIAAVSGGAVTACGHVAHIGERLRDRAIEVFGELESNVDLDSDKGGPSPHEEAHREILTSCFDDEAIGAVAHGPRLEIVLTGLPEKVPDSLAVFASLGLYSVDRLARGSTTKVLTGAAGIDEVRVDARNAARHGKLFKLLEATGRLPPLFAVDEWEGRPVIDGGSISDAPFPSDDEGPTLVLLTSEFRDVPHKDGRIFVMPSRTIPADKVDFTSPKDVEDAWNLGEEDGHAFMERWRSGPLDPERIYQPQ